MYKFGFIGTGNMGGALARAARKLLGADDILLANKDAGALEKIAAELGCATGANCDIAEKCRYIFLGVKPQIINPVIKEIAPVLRRRESGFVIVSMAAGVSIASIEAALDIKCPVIRIMPNMAASVGEGMVLLSSNEIAGEGEIREFIDLMSGAGRIKIIDEALMDAGCALSGSGPAFVFMFMEALANGGVACGLTSSAAAELAAQTVLGAAKLMLESGKHPAELKDSVCSPGGTTIAGVGALEREGFRGAVMEAVDAAYKRSRELGK